MAFLMIAAKHSEFFANKCACGTRIIKFNIELMARVAQSFICSDSEKNLRVTYVHELQSQF